MKPEDLPTVWSGPDYRHLTKKQISIRLPLLVAAKIEALGQMYPHKSRTEIIGDLLAAALEQVEEAFPSKKGNRMDQESEEYECDVFYDEGPKGTFRDLTARYLRNLTEESKLDVFDFEWHPPFIFEGLDEDGGARS